VLKEVSSEWAFALADDAKNFQEKNGVIVAKVVDKDFRDYALRQSPASPLDRAIEQHFATVVTVPASDSALDRAIEQHFAGIASFEGVASPVASSPASPLEQYLAGDVSRSGDKDYRDYAMRESVGPATDADVAFQGNLNVSFQGAPGPEVEPGTGPSFWAESVALDARSFSGDKSLQEAQATDRDYRDYALRDGSRPEAPVVLASSATGAMGGILNYSNNSLLADNGKEIIHVP
jgi:hypothetical protein